MARGGPLVDGAPYADESFIARLREYHTAAARAHREHSQPDVPLPVPTPAYAIDYSPADLYGDQRERKRVGQRDRQPRRRRLRRQRNGRERERQQVRRR